jgi:hypothetical protein
MSVPTEVDMFNFTSEREMSVSVEQAASRLVLAAGDGDTQAESDHGQATCATHDSKSAR